MARRRQPGSRRYPRTARLNELVREIVAEEIERIDDERLGFFTVTSVDVDPGIETAKIYWSDIGATDEVVLEVLAEHRPRLQQAVNRQTHMRRTPILSFHADEVDRSAARIEGILRDLDLPRDDDDTDDTDDSDDSDDSDDTDAWSRSKPSPWHGLVLVDKEAGWTSHDVVAKSRGILGTRKVGHAGTLDPPATGLLLVGVGNMTRLLRFLTALHKTYTGEIVLGTETDTLDDTGVVTATHDMAGVGLADVEAAARALTGEILQVPPMVSAIKIDGKRLHELAREGKEVEREARPITIHDFTVHGETGPGVFSVEVTCSSGTYIRTLAADLGAALGGGAHLRNLRRTRAGSHSVADAHRIDDVEAPAHVLSPADALRDLPVLVADTATAVDVGFGRPLHRESLGLPLDNDGPWAVQSQDGILLAVYGPHRAETIKPEVVLPT